MDAMPLASVAELWKRSSREFTASFGGTSMLPTIAPGQPVCVRCGDAIREGDVVLLIELGMPVVHRIVAEAPDWILTRGDGNLLPDVPLRGREHVVGRIAGIASASGLVPLPAYRATVFQSAVAALVRALLSAWFSGGRRLLQSIVALRRLSTAALLVLTRTAKP